MAVATQSNPRQGAGDPLDLTTVFHYGFMPLFLQLSTYLRNPQCA
jgi:hypothetical protein